MCLISSSDDGLLRIWDYNRPENLIDIVQTNKNKILTGLDLINDQYLLAACADGLLKEFDLYNKYASCSFNGVRYNDQFISVKHIYINRELYVFTHSLRGFIELWKL